MGLLRHAFVPLVFGAACLPDVDTDLTRVDEPRILAVRSEPAEVTPGEPAILTALYADGDGQIAAAPLDWAFCTARRPLAELGPVNKLCLAAGGDALQTIGEGTSVMATLPEDGCRLFGPDPPPAEPDQPAGRVVDPDLGGGYYQPIRVLPPDGLDALTLLQLRIRCGLAGATQQQAAEYRRRYKPNLAPLLTLTSEQLPISDDKLELRRGDELPLRAAWARCPEAPKCGDQACTLDEDTTVCAKDCGEVDGCGGAETYLVLDPTSLTLTTRREAIGVAWFATGGSFDTARTGRAPDETEAFSDNTWTAPDAPGPHTLWIVLRDDRGAASWRSVAVQVTP